MIDKIKQAVDRVLEAWDSLKSYGAHDGDCDNIEICEKCNSPVNGCSLHKETFSRRHAEMEQSVESLGEVMER